jgi:hypothetical protein
MDSTIDWLQKEILKPALTAVIAYFLLGERLTAVQMPAAC